MPLLLLEHPVILFNPNSPQSNALQRTPNLLLVDKLPRNPLFQKGFFPIEAIIVLGVDPTKLMHDESGPPQALQA